MNERFDLDATAEWRLEGLLLAQAGLIMLGTFLFVRGWENLLALLAGLGLYSVVILPLLWIATRQRFNYAELQPDQLHVRRMGFFTAELAYSEMEDVKPSHEHSLLGRFFTGNPEVVPPGGHIDVTVALPPGFPQWRRLRRILAARRLHIAVKERDRFVEALRRRLDARAGTPGAAIA